ncbi:MAG: hypothetical protein PVG65_06965 [Candidatus Thorarchaeota archaeon]
MKNRAYVVHSLFILILLLISACGEQEQSPVVDIQQSHYDPEVDTRSFYMSMTPHPYDYVPEATNETYAFVNTHTDMICHHFDNGIPWPEAYEQTEYHSAVEGDLDFRVKKLQKNQPVYLAIAPLHSDRYSMALYWGESSQMERPGEWKGKEFDDPQVITAYINFCTDLIERFDPLYMNYGVEVNGNWRSESDPHFQKFLIFSQQVYTALKETYPDLPIFISLMKTTGKLTESQKIINTLLLQYSDYVTVSSYPFGIIAGGAPGHPDNLPRDWFSSMAALAPEKPFAVAETGYNAEDLIIPEYNWDIEGKEEWQAAYVIFLLEEMNRLDAKFVVWFVSWDYDLAYERIESMDFPPWVKIWKDCGFLDEEGTPRQSLGIWDAWLQLERT